MKTKKNKTVLRGQMLPLTEDQVSAISTILKQSQKIRDLAIYRLAIDSMLRASDLMRVRVDEVLGRDGEVASELHVKTLKTSARVMVPLSEETRRCVKDWLATRPYPDSEWLFPGQSGKSHMTETRYRQLCKKWISAICLDPRHYSTHSLRRTKPAYLYQNTKNIKAISILLGHKNMRTTQLYLGVDEEMAINLARSYQI